MCPLTRGSRALVPRTEERRGLSDGWTLSATLTFRIKSPGWEYHRIWLEWWLRRPFYSKLSRLSSCWWCWWLCLCLWTTTGPSLTWFVQTLTLIIQCTLPAYVRLWRNSDWRHRSHFGIKPLHYSLFILLYNVSLYRLIRRHKADTSALPCWSRFNGDLRAMKSHAWSSMLQWFHIMKLRHMLVKARNPRLVQRLHRDLVASCNGNLVFRVVFIAPIQSNLKKCPLSCAILILSTCAVQSVDPVRLVQYVDPISLWCSIRGSYLPVLYKVWILSPCLVQYVDPISLWCSIRGSYLPVLYKVWILSPCLVQYVDPISLWCSVRGSYLPVLYKVWILSPCLVQYVDPISLCCTKCRSRPPGLCNMLILSPCVAQ